MIDAEEYQRLLVTMQARNPGMHVDMLKQSLDRYIHDAVVQALVDYDFPDLIPRSQVKRWELQSNRSPVSRRQHREAILSRNETILRYMKIKHLIKQKSGERDASGANHDVLNSPSCTSLISNASWLNDSSVDMFPTALEHDDHATDPRDDTLQLQTSTMLAPGDPVFPEERTTTTVSSLKSTRRDLARDQSPERVSIADIIGEDDDYVPVFHSKPHDAEGEGCILRLLSSIDDPND